MSKYLKFFKLIAMTGTFQVLVQALSFVCGILVIRLLPIQEYALYTLANTMLGTMTILSDGGITSGVMAQGGKVWEDRTRLGRVLATGLELRRKFAIVSLLVSVPVLIFLLRRNEASWLATGLIVLALIPAFYAALTDSLLEVIPKLHQSILPLQKNQVSVAAARLMFSALTLFIFPWAFVAILASGFPRIYGNIQLRQISSEFIEKNALPDIDVRNNVLMVVRRTLPGAIYYSISGQITIWLISIYGNVQSVAQLGALGRLAMAIGIISTMINILVVPRFARLHSDGSLLIRRFVQIELGLFGICASILVVTWFCSDNLLWVLGNGYRDLTEELMLMVICACVAMASSTLGALNAARQFFPAWYFNPGVGTIATIFFAYISNLNDLTGVLQFNLMLALTSLFFGNAVFIYFNSFKRQRYYDDNK